jgi:hypothetical protein
MEPDRVVGIKFVAVCLLQERPLPTAQAARQTVKTGRQAGRQAGRKRGAGGQGSPRHSHRLRNGPIVTDTDRDTDRDTLSRWGLLATAQPALCAGGI